MQVRFLDRQRTRLPLARLRRLALGIMEAEMAPENAELSVLFCGERLMRNLNRRYRRRPQATDVLSFPQNGLPAAAEVQLLGDVVVCIPVARRQARRQGSCLSQEVAQLLAHGLLHLLGYRDDRPPAARAMERRQSELLARLWNR